MGAVAWRQMPRFPSSLIKQGSQSLTQMHRGAFGYPVRCRRRSALRRGDGLAPYCIGKWGRRDYYLRRVWRTDRLGSKSGNVGPRRLISDKNTFTLEETHDKPMDQMAYSPASPEPSWY